MIGAIVLAAGKSRRYGNDKRQARLPSGKMVIEESILALVDLIPEIIVVLRDHDEALLTALKKSIPRKEVSYFCAPDANKGMAHSLANGIKEAKDWDAALIALGDMPYLQPGTIKGLLNSFQHHRQSCSPIILPIYQNKPGHPVIFARAYFDEIEQLTGDNGAKAIIEAHPDAVFRIEVDDPGVRKDIDTPADISS